MSQTSSNAHASTSRIKASAFRTPRNKQKRLKSEIRIANDFFLDETTPTSLPAHHRLKICYYRNKFLDMELDGQCYLKVYPKYATLFPRNAPRSMPLAEVHRHYKAALLLANAPDDEVLDYHLRLAGLMEAHLYDDWELHGTVEDALKRLSGGLHDGGITQNEADALILHRNYLRDVGSDEVSPELVPLLHSQGVSCSSTGFKGHAHGAHKAIENHMLYAKLPGLINGDTTFLSMKKSKFERLTKRLPRRFAYNLMNPMFELRDISRFSNSPDFDLDGVLDTLVLDHGAHYFSPESLASLFAHCPRLQRVVAFGVWPGEVAYGLSSLYPTLYQTRLHEDGSFTYELEGHSGGSYEHNSDFWMLHPTTVLNVTGEALFHSEPLDHAFAHHVIEVSRRVPPTSRAEHRLAHHDLRRIPLMIKSEKPRREHGLEVLVPEILLSRVLDFMPGTKDPLNAKALNARLASLKHSSANKGYSLATWEFMRRQAHAAARRDLDDTGLGIFEEDSRWNRALLSDLLAAAKPLDLAKPLAAIVATAVGSGLLATTTPLAIAIPILVSGGLLLTDSLIRLLRNWLRSSRDGRQSHLYAHSVEDRIDIVFPRQRITAQFTEDLWGGLKPLAVPRSAPTQESSKVADDEPELHPEELELEDEETETDANDEEEGKAPSVIESAESEPNVDSESEPEDLLDYDLSSIKPATSVNQASTRTRHAEDDEADQLIEDFIVKLPARIKPSQGKIRLSAVLKGGRSLALGPFANMKVHAGLPRITKYIPTCGIEAIAQCLQIEPSFVHRQLCETFSAAQMSEWLHDGHDERSLIAAAFLNTASFTTSQYPSTALGHTRPSDKGGRLEYDKKRRHWACVTACVVSAPKLQSFEPASAKDASAAAQEFVAKLLTHVDGNGNQVLFGRDTYTADLSRAKDFAEELAAGYVGTIKSREGSDYAIGYSEQLYQAVKHAKSIKEEIKTELIVVEGFAGCGKSSPVKDFLRGLSNKEPMGTVFRHVSPRVNIRDTWKEEVGFDHDPYRFATLETALKPGFEVMILEETSLYPAGYVDVLIAVARPAFVICLGDRTQAEGHNPHKSSHLGTCKEHKGSQARPCLEGSHVFSLIPHPYLLYGHRHPQVIEKFLEVATTNPNKGSVTVTRTKDFKWPLLVSQTNLAANLKEQGFKAYTIPGYQGEEENVIQILIDDPMLVSVKKNHCVTALTRTKNHIRFVVHSDRLEAALRKHHIFGALLNGIPRPFTTLFKAELANTTPVKISNTKRNKIKNARLSKGFTMPQAKLGPNLTSVYSDVHPGLVLPVQAGYAEERVEHYINVTLPVMDPEVISAHLLLENPERYQREFHRATGLSAVYDDGDKLCDVHALMFPKQSTTDEPFRAATIEKRLQSGSVEANERDFERSADRGQTLFDNLAAALQLPDDQPFDEELFFECMREQLEVRTEHRSIQQLLALESRADFETLPNFVKVWIKNQDKTKLEALLLLLPKAGQTLVTMHEIFLALIGPAVRYTQRHVFKYKPDNIVINLGLNLEQLNEEVQRLWKQDPTADDDAPNAFGTANDFSEFDTAQRGDSVHLDVKTMANAGVPKEILKFYARIKLSIRTDAIGFKQTARDTGEPGTFFFNTLYSIACTAMKYGFRQLHNGCWLFGGDDMATDQTPDESPWWIKHGHTLVSVKSKTFRKRLVDFCGWLLSPSGIIRDPLLIFLKIMHRDATRGDTREVLASYATEIRFSYLRAETYVAFASVEEQACLQYVVRRVHEEFPILATRLFNTLGSAVEALKAQLSKLISIGSPRKLLQAYEAAVVKLNRGYTSFPQVKSSAMVCFNSDAPINMFTCRQEGKTFSTEQGLASHLWAVHGINLRGYVNGRRSASNNNNSRSGTATRGRRRSAGPGRPANPPPYAEVPVPGSTELTKTEPLGASTNVRLFVVHLSGPAPAGLTGARKLVVVPNYAVGARVNKIAVEYRGKTVGYPTGVTGGHIAALVTSNVPDNSDDLINRMFAMGSLGTHDMKSAFTSWSLLAGTLVTNTTDPRYLLVATVTEGTTAASDVPGELKFIIDVAGSQATTFPTL